MYEYDELKIYCGDDIPITSKITVTIPTVRQIKEFGEQRYFSAVYNLTSVGADLKWQLWDIGIDYTKIGDWELFYKLIFQLVSSKKEIAENPEEYNLSLDDKGLNELLINPMTLVFKGLDFADFKPRVNKDSKQIDLYNSKDDITFDKLAYYRVVEIVRKIHGFKRNNQVPANERTKMDLIEDARDEAMAMKSKPFKSLLLPLISTLQVKCGQCGDNKILDMPISALFDNVKRVSKIQEATMLLQGAYSGFADLKGVDKSRLDIFGDI